LVVAISPRRLHLLPVQSSPKIRPVFCFLDESGTILGDDSKYFALGAIVHPRPDELIENLHKVFEGLVADCSKHRTAQEFHFTDVTLGTVKHFIKCMDCLEQDKDWRFFSVVLDVKDSRFKKPNDALGAWSCYLRWAKIMLQRNLYPEEKATLVADFLRRPKGSTHSLASLPGVVPQLWDVLQVESHGVLLVQMTDVILGASIYQGKSECKMALAERVAKLRLSMPKWRFNEWRVAWPTSLPESSAGR
jgi:Protein of unknown function (DUF3800)